MTIDSNSVLLTLVTAVLLLLTVFLTPLIGAYKDFGYQQAVAFGYEQAKILFFILSVSLIGFLWMFQKPKLKWNLIKLASFIFVLTLFLTSFLGIDPKNSFLGKDPYFQGLLVYAYLFLFSLMVSIFNIKLEKWAEILVGSASLVALLAIKDWVLLNIFNQTVPTYAGRVVSSFGQPNFYAGFLLLTLPFAYLLFKNSNKKLSYFGIFSGLISISAIFVSYSRSAVMLALLLFILALIDQLKVKLKVGFVVFAIIIISIFIALKFSSGLVGTEFTKPNITNYSDQTKFSVEKRIYIWPQALKVAGEKPLVGYGLENMPQAFSDYFIKFKHPLFEENLNISPVLISFKDLNLDRTHSYILDLLMFSGILGVGIWLILVYVLLAKVKNRIILVGLITYLIWIQFQNQSIVHLLYFWLLVGLIDRGE